MPDNHYMHPHLARLYDITGEPQPGEEEFFLSLAPPAPARVLDVGCGVGKLCNAFAEQGHHVTGADPASAMLAVAKAKPHGASIQWVETDVQHLNLGSVFDLATMTGHAFQVLQTDEDIRAALTTLHRHLAPGGLLSFESRNPEVDWADLWSNRAASTLELDGGPVTITTNVLEQSGEFLTFEHVYVFPDEELRSQSTLRFASRARIEELLLLCGYTVREMFGNWDRRPFSSASSPEMIFVAERLA